jgi:hypothetical protein
MNSQAGKGRLEILGEKPSAAGDTGKHSRPQFFIVPKGRTRNRAIPDATIHGEIPFAA